MATPDRSNGGAVVGVRLTEVPIAIRRRRGRALYEHAVSDGDLIAAMRLRLAIEEPSDRVYWVPAEAVREVLG